MKTCTFFGHRDAPGSIKPAIRAAILDLIQKEGVARFLVGRNGAFDRMVLGILRELAAAYPIQYAVVVERLPDQRQEHWQETLLPDCLEQVPPRFAIWHRNKWMVEQSDYAVVYIRRSFGGAAQFAEMARKKKKKVIYINE